MATGNTTYSCGCPPNYYAEVNTSTGTESCLPGKYFASLLPLGCGLGAKMLPFGMQEAVCLNHAVWAVVSTLEKAHTRVSALLSFTRAWIQALELKHAFLVNQLSAVWLLPFEQN